jgi:hypothetical protein
VRRRHLRRPTAPASRRSTRRSATSPRCRRRTTTRACASPTAPALQPDRAELR